MTPNQAILALYRIKECRMVKYRGECPGDCMDCEYRTGALELSDACNIAIDAIQTVIKGESEEK